MLQHFTRFCRDETGATAIEYGLIAALMGVAVIAAMRNLGNSTQTLFNKTSQNMNAV
jgi:pilus assembly protein Flp/PilA